MATVRHLGLFPKPCLELGQGPENYHAKNIQLQPAMNLVWRLQKIRVKFTGRIKTLFRSVGCDGVTPVEQFVSHEIDTEFFLYFQGNINLTEKDIVCGGGIVYSGQEEGADPRSSLSITVRSNPTAPIYDSQTSSDLPLFDVPLFLDGGFLPLDRKQKSNSEYVVLAINSPDRAQLILPLPEGSGWNLGSTTLNVLLDQYMDQYNQYTMDFAFASDDPESAPPTSISCVDPESGPYESPFFAQNISQEIDEFTLTPFYWPYDPNDGGGPIYDNTTGEQLRPFPA
jgi:hypothetical protein